jgi:hypothetical protein
MKNLEPTLLQGIFLCLWDSEAIRLQSSRWKRSLLVFTSGVCLEIATFPHLASWMGYELAVPPWFFTLLFLPLGLIGIYASRFGNDRFVEWLLVVPKLDLKP